MTKKVITCCERSPSGWNVKFQPEACENRTVILSIEEDQVYESEMCPKCGKFMVIELSSWAG